MVKFLVNDLDAKGSWEQPAGGYMFDFLDQQRALDGLDRDWHILHMCRYGRAYKKPTVFFSFGGLKLPSLNRRCTTEDSCGRAYHLQLGFGDLSTHDAAVYPRQLCAAYAADLRRDADRRQLALSAADAQTKLHDMRVRGFSLCAYKGALFERPVEVARKEIHWVSKVLRMPGSWIGKRSLFELTELLLALDMSPVLILMLIMALIFLLGWPLEWVPIVLIIVPILIPVLIKLDVNLVWFGILVAVNLQTAWLSPPVALSAYFLKGVVPEWDLKDIYLGMMQFMVIQVIGLVLIFVFPQIALWLPTLIYGE